MRAFRPQKRIGARIRYVADLQHQIRAFRSSQRAANALLLYRTGRLAKSGSIAKHERVTIQIERDFDDIAGGTRLS